MCWMKICNTKTSPKTWDLGQSSLTILYQKQKASQRDKLPATS